MLSPPTWKIHAPSDRCARTGTPFRDGEVFYSCLTESPEGDGYLREDYSEASWSELRSQLRPFSFWRSVFEAKPAPSPGPGASLPPRDAESLLHRLLEANDPSTERVRYILTLLLERKRILRPVGRETRAGHALLLYEHHRTGEIFLITDPDLSLDQAAEVEHEVRAWLEPRAEEAT